MMHKHCVRCKDRQPGCHDHCAHYHADELRRYIQRRKERGARVRDADLDNCAIMRNARKTGKV